MARQLQNVWDSEKGMPILRSVPVEELPKKKVRYRGKNKIPNFQDKVKANKKGITAYQYACVITHRARFGADPFLKIANNWT
tara:strand:+ start:112 stop:357 length:246 start_codon:yes stop_codon:yes gene_type:complete